MADSESDVPRCPFCGSQEGCNHMICDLDRTFHEVEGGCLFTNEGLLMDPIIKLLRQRLWGGALVENTGWEALDQLIDTAEDLYDPKTLTSEDEIEDLIDMDVLYDLFIAYLRGHAHIAHYVLHGPPSFSTSNYVAWSEYAAPKILDTCHVRSVV